MKGVLKSETLIALRGRGCTVKCSVSYSKVLYNEIVYYKCCFTIYKVLYAGLLMKQINRTTQC